MTSLNYAAPFTHPATSPIRALLPFANRPGTVSFAGGYPDPALFNVADLRAASARVNERLIQCLQYSGTEGQPLLRQQLAALSAERGIHCDPDQELIVTGGSQQALSLIAQVMLQEGDKVVIESPCFPTTAQALRHTGAQLLPVPSGPAGIDLLALEALLQREQPKMICVVATFSNPVGSTLSEANRRRLLALALKHRVLVVEDDPYSDLRYQGERVPPLLALASEAEREWVVYLSSLSKTVAPSLRLGWLLAAPELRRRCLSAKQADDLSASPWIQEIAGEYLQAGSYPRHLPVLLQAYGARCRSMCAALRDEFGSALEFSEPAGGMFVWARLTGGRRADNLLKLAIDEEVVFVPGSAFYPDPALTDPAALRLSFASVDSDLIREGVSRMARALRQMD